MEAGEAGTLGDMGGAEGVAAVLAMARGGSIADEGVEWIEGEGATGAGRRGDGCGCGERAMYGECESGFDGAEGTWGDCGGVGAGLEIEDG